VKPEYRRRGVGRALAGAMEAVMQWNSREGIALQGTGLDPFE
jgi:hypothetical protein